MYEDIINQLWSFIQDNLKFIFMITIFPGLAFIFIFVIFAVWFKRKYLARLMLRMGPVHAGKVLGWLQLIADAIKLIAKEFIIPRTTLKFLFFLLPILLPVIPACLVLLIPYAEDYIVFEAAGNGLLLFLAIATIYPVLSMLTGWVANNKFTIIGALRTIYMDVAAEIPMVIAVLGVVILTGSFDFVKIVEAQSKIWFIGPQILGFIVFIIGCLGMTERVPMDFPVAEPELILGVKTEYTGPLYLLMMEADFVNWLAWLLLLVTLYLGGYNGPDIFMNKTISGIFWVLVKLLVVMILLMTIEVTYARLRVDQAVRLGWRILIPLSLLNLVISILLRYYMPWMWGVG